MENVFRTVVAPIAKRADARAMATDSDGNLHMAFMATRTTQQGSTTPTHCWGSGNIPLATAEIFDEEGAAHGFDVSEESPEQVATRMGLYQVVEEV